MADTVLDLEPKIIMNRYHFDVKHIEMLLRENQQRKDKLRRKNSIRLLAVMLFLLCIFSALYQI